MAGTIPPPPPPPPPGWTAPTATAGVGGLLAQVQQGRALLPVEALRKGLEQRRLARELGDLSAFLADLSHAVATPAASRAVAAALSEGPFPAPQGAPQEGAPTDGASEVGREVASEVGEPSPPPHPALRRAAILTVAERSQATPPASSIWAVPLPSYLTPHIPSLHKFFPPSSGPNGSNSGGNGSNSGAGPEAGVSGSEAGPSAPSAVPHRALDAILPRSMPEATRLEILLRAFRVGGDEHGERRDGAVVEGREGPIIEMGRPLLFEGLKRRIATRLAAPPVADHSVLTRGEAHDPLSAPEFVKQLREALLGAPGSGGATSVLGEVSSEEERVWVSTRLEALELLPGLRLSLPAISARSAACEAIMASDPLRHALRVLLATFNFLNYFRNLRPAEGFTCEGLTLLSDTKAADNRTVAHVLYCAMARDSPEGLAELLGMQTLLGSEPPTTARNHWIQVGDFVPGPRVASLLQNFSTAGCRSEMHPESLQLLRDVDAAQTRLKSTIKDARKWLSASDVSTDPVRAVASFLRVLDQAGRDLQWARMVQQAGSEHALARDVRRDLWARAMEVPELTPHLGRTHLRTLVANVATQAAMPFTLPPRPPDSGGGAAGAPPGAAGAGEDPGTAAAVDTVPAGAAGVGLQALLLEAWGQEGGRWDGGDAGLLEVARLMDGGGGGGHEGAVLYHEFGETRRLADGRLYLMQAAELLVVDAAAPTQVGLPVAGTSLWTGALHGYGQHVGGAQ